MRILLGELKKIFNWKILLILFLFTVLYYFMFLRAELIQYYPNGHPSTEQYQISMEMKQKYGTTIDAAEQKDFEKTFFPKAKAQVSQIIVGLKDFQNAKIYNIDELEALSETDSNQDKNKTELYDKLYCKLAETYSPGSDINKPMYFYQVIRDQVTYFKMSSKYTATEDQFPKNRWPRVKEVDSRSALSVLPDCAMESWGNLSRWFILLLLITVLVLISPYLVRDRMGRVQQIAYTCKSGRKFLLCRMKAALAAAVLGILAQSAVFFTIFFCAAHHNDPVFFDCNISGLMNSVYWFDLTFGQYIMITVALMAMLTVGFALLSFVISKFCKNYVSVLAAMIPVFVAGDFICKFVFQNLFRIFKPICGEVWLCVGILFAGLLLNIILIKREKKVDILN